MCNPYYPAHLLVEWREQEKAREQIGYELRQILRRKREAVK